MNAPYQGTRLSYQTQRLLERVVLPTPCIPRGTQADGLRSRYPHDSNLALTWLVTDDRSQQTASIFQLDQFDLRFGSLSQNIDDPSKYSDEASLEAYAGPDGQVDGLRLGKVANRVWQVSHSSGSIQDARYSIAIEQGVSGMWFWSWLRQREGIACSCGL